MKPDPIIPGQTPLDASAVRGEYLEAVRAADRGDYGRLIALHERYAGDNQD